MNKRIEMKIKIKQRERERERDKYSPKELFQKQ